MRLQPAGAPALLDRYIGYWKPYATSHAELDEDKAIQEEVANPAPALARPSDSKRSGKQVAAGSDLPSPRRE